MRLFACCWCCCSYWSCCWFAPRRCGEKRQDKKKDDEAKIIPCKKIQIEICGNGAVNLFGDYTEIVTEGISSCICPHLNFYFNPTRYRYTAAAANVAEGIMNFYLLLPTSDPPPSWLVRRANDDHIEIYRALWSPGGAQCRWNLKWATNLALR